MQRKIEEIESKSQAILAAIDNFHVEQKRISDDKDTNFQTKEKLCEALFRKTIEALQASSIVEEEAFAFARSLPKPDPETMDRASIITHLQLLNRAYDAISKAADAYKKSREFLLVTHKIFAEDTHVPPVTKPDTSNPFAIGTSVLNMFRPESPPSSSQSAAEDKPGHGLKR